jgi:TolA-binding protein
LLVLFVVLFSVSAHAQEQLQQMAKQYLLAGDYAKATPLYKQLLEYNESDNEIITAYIQCLMGLQQYDVAEKWLKKEVKKDKNSPLQFELGLVYLATNDKKKADKLFRALIDQLPPLDDAVQKLAYRFDQKGLTDYAIATYMKGRSMNENMPYYYAEELAILYSKQGNEEKAITSLMELYLSVPEKGEVVKGTLLRLLDKPEKLKAFQQTMQQKATENPNIIAYPDLLSWLLIQQKDYAGAFQQIKSIDLKLDEQGRRVLGFARACLREREYDAALLAYNHVIERGKDYPFYQIARGEKLTTMKEKLRRNPHYTEADVVPLEQEYESFLEEYPVFKQKETMREYADLEVRYKQDVDKAIAILKEASKPNNPDRLFKGKCKLDMGDYELMRNDIWESTLLYSQVDKDFKQDALGEEARYRNAKLSYYSGDFDWAQGQLDVLKASTSELIANDALNLSVLITENNPPADSNTTPLVMFARADLLEFQNRNEEAVATLDSITTEFPSHPLMDNILMKKADIAYKKQDYNEAALYLQQIVTNYGDDVLADDALYNLAAINENFFSNNDEAKRLYEQLIQKYPGSTYINPARKAFRRLRGDKADVEG